MPTEPEVQRFSDHRPSQASERMTATMPRRRQSFRRPNRLGRPIPKLGPQPDGRHPRSIRDWELDLLRRPRPTAIPRIRSAEATRALRFPKVLSPDAQVGFLAQMIQPAASQRVP